MNRAVVTSLDNGSKSIGDGKDQVSPTVARASVLGLYRAGMTYLTPEQVQAQLAAWQLTAPTPAELDMPRRIQGTNGRTLTGERTRNCFVCTGDLSGREDATIHYCVCDAAPPEKPCHGQSVGLNKSAGWTSLKDGTKNNVFE